LEIVKSIKAGESLSCRSKAQKEKKRRTGEMGGPHKKKKTLRVTK